MSKYDFRAERAEAQREALERLVRETERYIDNLNDEEVRKRRDKERRALRTFHWVMYK
jgi:hypothetical protein